MAMIRPTEEEEEEEEGCFFLQNNLLLVSAVSTATHKFLQTLQNLFAIEVSVDWLKLVWSQKSLPRSNTWDHMKSRPGVISSIELK